MNYYILVIILIGILIICFSTVYILNQRTPVPKECEELMATTEKCSSCANPLCKFSRKKEEE